jgi:hypothetical protein
MYKSIVVGTYPINLNHMKHILTILLAISSWVASGQDSTQSTQPQFKLSINYNSGLNFFGRTDSLKSTGLFPMAEFWATPNFYINAAPIFVNNAIQKMEYAGTVASLGYQYMNEKWLTNINVVKPFYKGEAQLVQSALKAQTNLSVTKLNKIANLTLGGDIKWSDKTDFGATAGIDHIIRIENKDKSVLVFDPSFYAYAGTQQFSRTYNKKQNNGLPVVGNNNNQQVTETSTQFNVLAYEFSIPVIFAKNKLMFIATPSYIMPQNLMTVPDRRDLSEKGENMLYTTLSVKYTF